MYVNLRSVNSYGFSVNIIKTYKSDLYKLGTFSSIAEVKSVDEGKFSKNEIELTSELEAELELGVMFYDIQTLLQSSAEEIYNK